MKSSVLSSYPTRNYCPSGRGERTASKTATRGFTLIEVLTAMTVLSLLVVMISSLLNSVSLTVASSNKHLNADSQARLVLDRMQMDLGRMLRRSDVYFQFGKNNGNDQVTFYSETPGYFPANTPAGNESNLSLISYQFNSSYQFQRLGQGYQWSDIAFSPTTAPTFTAADLHVMSTSVFRMQMAFLQRTGDTTCQITSTAPTPGSQAFQSCYAVMVAIALLDPDSQKLVNSSSYTSLVAALPDFTGSQTISLSATSAPNAATTDPILSLWESKMAASNFAQTAGIPSAAAQQVRVYQRMIYLQ